VGFPERPRRACGMVARTMTSELAKAYNPKDVEPRWYAFWLEHGVFAASDDPADARPVYALPIPPPNVTGSLHMGHALVCTIEDVLVRYHRMRGFNTLWQPGIDHAGIATQTVVERVLKREGKTRHDLGREAFVQRVWQWKAQSGGRIALQLRVLGVSVDWPRSKFTMDPEMCRAVREAFVRLHGEGLVYRDTRLIHWDCEAQTVLSNLEVENEPANGELFEFAYPVEDGGTGAVKVTPAHDFNDFATGKRHGLPEITILNLDGTMNANAGPFAGMDRFVARKAVK
jgi:valyl-tRNA synthetase